MDTARRSELLAYLGYRGQEVTPELERRMASMCELCDDVARPAYVMQAFDVERLPIALPGKDIAEHLHDAREVVLFAVTLGHGVDRELRRLAATDSLGQVLFDAAATAAIEREAGRVEAKVRLDAAQRGLFCSWRFSPGYGDLPLGVQPAILRTLNATRRLGITLTPSYLMIPTKSVTAIVGVHSEPQPGLASSCDVCELRDLCELRKRGASCRPHSGTARK